MNKFLSALLLGAFYFVGSAQAVNFQVVDISSNAFGGVNVDSTTIQAIPPNPFSINRLARVVNYAVDDSTSTVYFSTSPTPSWNQLNGFPLGKEGKASIDLKPLAFPTTFFFIRKEADGAGFISVRWWVEYSEGNQ